MKDKEVKVTKVKEVNSRSVRRKMKKGTNNVKEDLGKTVVLKKKDVAKELQKLEKKETKKPEVKKEVKVVTNIPENTKKYNKIPYVLFTLLSILYFAVTIILVGYTSYKTVAIIRAKNNDRLTTYVREDIVENSYVFKEDNVRLYKDNIFGDNKVITYYYIVSVSMIATSLLLAMAFSYLSETFTDKNFRNPFSNTNLALIKKCIVFVVCALCISAVSVVLQKLLTPFSASTIESTSVLTIAIALIVSYLVLLRGNEIVKE